MRVERPAAYAVRGISFSEYLAHDSLTSRSPLAVRSSLLRRIVDAERKARTKSEIHCSIIGF